MRYALVDQGVAVQVLRVNPFTVIAESYAKQFIECPDEVECDWRLTDGVWTAPPAPTDEQVAAEVRGMRNLIIASTDWTQAADVPQAVKDKYTAYRQALRDVPAQVGFPRAINWPVAP
jgi:hypothetical protein